MEETLAEFRILVHGLSLTMFGRAQEVKSMSSLAPPSLSKDSPVCLVFALFFFLINWGLRLLLLEPLGTRALHMDRLRTRKFAQSCLEALIYGSFSAVGFRVVLSQPWLWPSVQWWQGGNQDFMSADLRCYYIMYMARYMQGIVSVLLEPKRKDFAEMLVHHVVTVFLTFLSYTFLLSRVGAVTMLILDPADVPLQLAKVFKYISEATDRRLWQKLADGLFAIFAVVFFVTRILIFGYVVWSSSVEGPPNLRRHRFDLENASVGFACLGLMNMLLILQLYWFYLIMRVASKLVRTGQVDDVRSDDEASPENSPMQVALRAKKDSKAGRKAKETEHDLRGIHAVGIAAPILLLSFGFVSAMHQDGILEPMEAELNLLIRGLGNVVFRGTAAAGTLSHSPPDIRRDSAVFAVFTVALFLLNWGLRLLIVEPFSVWTLKLKRLQLAKFVQSFMEAFCYGGFALIGLRVVPSQDWIWPSAKWWIGFAEGGHEVMRADLRCYYIMYIARYAQAVVTVLLEPKRKDIVAMLLHHIVTVVVIYISYVYGWNRVGVVVMVLLDPADVPLHLAKLCKYTAEATKLSLWQRVADRLFEVFAVLFFVTRIVMYGYVCWSAHIEATRYFPKGLPEWTCVVCLYTLLLLQIYWFSLIMKVAMMLLWGGGAEDPRSDDDSEDEVARQKKDH